MKELRNIKRFSIFIILFLFLITIFGCKKTDNNPDEINNNGKDVIDHTIFPNEGIGLLKDKKIYVTSIGQSNEAYMFDYRYQDKLEYEFDMQLEPDKVEEGSMVLVFVGCSIKALEESNLSVNDEKNRMDEFILLKNNKKLDFIGLHLGGIERRGYTSDSLIELVFSTSCFNIYVGKGNQDSFLSNISINNKIPCLEVASAVSLEQPLKLLKGEES